MPHLRRSAAVAITLALAAARMDAQHRTATVPPTPVGDECSRFIYTVEITVRHPDGRPVTDGTITVTRARDGRRVPTAGPAAIGSGEYQIIADDDLALVDAAGETFRVRVERPGSVAAGDLRIGRAGPGGCHVKKLAGPDTLVARPTPATRTPAARTPATPAPTAPRRPGGAD